MATIQEKNTRFALPLVCPWTGETVSAETLYNRCCEKSGETVRDYIGDLIFDNLDYSAGPYDDAALCAAVYVWADSVRAEIAAPKAKQISRVNYGFIPGNAIGLVTLTRDSAANPRRPYRVEFSFRNSSDVWEFKTFRRAASAYRGDCFKRRHGFAVEA